MAKCRDGVAMEAAKGFRRSKAYSTCPFSELRFQLINPSTSPDELNMTVRPHSIIHGDGCFAYLSGRIPAGATGLRIEDEEPAPCTPSCVL
jgi:hypothetical protein